MASHRVRAHRTVAAAFAVACLAWPAPIAPVSAGASVARATPDSSIAPRGVQEGIVSWYGARFHDRRTASGERFDAYAMTMAHPTLPFGTSVRVTNLRNGRSVIVRVNDRGPHVGKRIADLSHAAAAEIGMLRRGLTLARIEVLGTVGGAAAGR